MGKQPFHDLEVLAKEVAAAANEVADGRLELSLDAELTDNSSTESPSLLTDATAPPILKPSFGLGLARQRSFAPHIVTEAEASAQHDMRRRCAVALGRLARRSRQASVRRLARRGPIA